jgi:hypothetical protein
MFELQKLQGPSERGIALQTRAGRDIANSQGADLAEIHRARYAAFLRRYGNNWKQRRSPTGCYNCAGHIWASRRTCIYEETELQAILGDDGYRRTQHPTPDDVALYRDPNVGILHVARIVELRHGITRDSRRIPWLVSKWDNWTGEVLHFEHDHPYRSQGFSVTIEYWTDRPAEGEGSSA